MYINVIRFSFSNSKKNKRSELPQLFLKLGKWKPFEWRFSLDPRLIVLNCDRAKMGGAKVDGAEHLKLRRRDHTVGKIAVWKKRRSFTEIANSNLEIYIYFNLPALICNLHSRSGLHIRLISRVWKIWNILRWAVCKLK